MKSLILPQTRAGAEFSPYLDQVNTSLSLLQLYTTVTADLDDDDGDDAEGAELEPLLDLDVASTTIPTVSYPTTSLAASTSSATRSGSARRRHNKRVKLCMETRGLSGIPMPRFTAQTVERFSEIEQVLSPLKLEELPAASGADVGRRVQAHRSKPWAVEELMTQGFSYEAWDGMCVFSSAKFTCTNT